MLLNRKAQQFCIILSIYQTFGSSDVCIKRDAENDKVTP